MRVGAPVNGRTLPSADDGRPAQLGRVLFHLGLVVGQARLDLLERRLHLVLGQLLRPPGKTHVLQLVQQVPRRPFTAAGVSRSARV